MDAAELDAWRWMLSKPMIAAPREQLIQLHFAQYRELVREDKRPRADDEDDADLNAVLDADGGTGGWARAKQALKEIKDRVRREALDAVVGPKVPKMGGWSAIASGGGMQNHTVHKHGCDGPGKGAHNI